MGSPGNVVVVDALEGSLDMFSLGEENENLNEMDSKDVGYKCDVDAKGKAVAMKSCCISTSSSSSFKSQSHVPCEVEELVSCMKGTREKLGAPPRRLSVTWSPDVYDPVPNSLSHTVKGKMKSKKGKNKDKSRGKNKKGQKGNAFKGSNVKDKTQVRNDGGRTVDAVERFVHPSGDLIDFTVGSPDFCGSSFLKESQTKFQFLLC